MSLFQKNMAEHQVGTWHPMPPARHFEDSMLRFSVGCGGGGGYSGPGPYPFAAFISNPFPRIVLSTNGINSEMDLTEKQARLLMEDLQEALEKMKKNKEAEE